MGHKNIFIEFTADTNNLRAFAEVAVKFAQEQGLKADRVDPRKIATIHIRPKTVLEYMCRSGELVQYVADDARFNHTVYNSARGSQFAVQVSVFALLKALKSCWKYIARPNVLVRVEGDNREDMMLYLCNTVSEEVYASITCGITSARGPQKHATDHVAYVEANTFDASVATCVKNTSMLKSSREFAHTIRLRAASGLLRVEQTDAIRLTRCDIVVLNILDGFNQCVNARELRAASSVFDKYSYSRKVDMRVDSATNRLVFTTANDKRFLVALPHVENDYPASIDKAVGSYFERLCIPGGRLKKLVATIGKHIESKHCPVKIVMSNDALMLAVDAPTPAEYGYYAVCDSLARVGKPSVFGVRVHTLDFDLLKTAVASIADKQNVYVELAPTRRDTAIFGVSTIGFDRRVHFPTMTDQRPSEQKVFERVVLGHFDKNVYGVFASSGVVEGQLDSNLQADLPEPINMGELKQLLNVDKPVAKETVGSEVAVVTPSAEEQTMASSDVEVVEATVVEDEPEDTSVSVQAVEQVENTKPVKRELDKVELEPSNYAKAECMSVKPSSVNAKVSGTQTLQAEPQAEPKAEPQADAGSKKTDHAMVSTIPAGIPVKQIPVLQGAERKPKALRDDKGRKLAYVAVVQGKCVVVLRDWYKRDDKRFERTLASVVEDYGFTLAD